MNHPIREDFLLESKQEAKLTREHSLFTLPNKKGKIELRAPDGKVLQEIKYKLQESIGEDIVYKKEKGTRWEWQETQEDTSPLEEEEEIETTPTLETTPEEKTAIPETPKEENVLPEPAPLVEKKDSQAYIPLLNYGTSVEIPAHIALTFEDLSEVPFPIENEHYAVTFTKSVFTELNSTLNTLLHSTEE